MKELTEPQEVATLLNNHGAVPHICCVASPYFIGGKHIVGAVFDGPASKTEGIADLRTAVRTLSKDAAVVIYSGCCPMKACPNIRPAYLP